MALHSCRECGKLVSSDAKKCPHCGIKKPYRKTWDDVPHWQKVFTKYVTLPIVLFFAFMIAVSVVNREDSLLRDVKALSEDQVKEKYEGYAKLYEIDATSCYRNKAIEYAKEYLRTVPATEASTNLNLYERLAELDSESNYKAKIALYSFMVSVSTDCAIAAEALSKKTLRNPSTYDSNILETGGRWLSRDRYGYVHSFDAANSFGVTTKFTAEYVCHTDSNTRKYRVERISLARN
jgi:hypothetical protein